MTLISALILADSYPAMSTGDSPDMISALKKLDTVTGEQKSVLVGCVQRFGELVENQAGDDSEWSSWWSAGWLREFCRCVSCPSSRCRLSAEHVKSVRCTFGANFGRFKSPTVFRWFCSTQNDRGSNRLVRRCRGLSQSRYVIRNPVCMAHSSRSVIASVVYHAV